MAHTEKDSSRPALTPVPRIVLSYHSLDRSGSVISVAPEDFRSQMRCLAASGRPVVPLTALPGTPGSIAITFDDGIRNFYQGAFPILKEHGFPATVFVVTGHCGGRNDWSSQPAGIPSLDLMTWQEIKEVSRYGIQIGAHTVTHPRLSQLSRPEVLRELRESRDDIENRTGQAVNTFAYPYGDQNAAVKEIAAGHFRIACGTTLDFVGLRPQLEDLPRLDVYYLRAGFLFRRITRGHGRSYIFARRSLRDLRRLTSSEKP